MPYHAFALILPNTEIDLELLIDRLAERLRHMTVVRRGMSIDVSRLGWSMVMDFINEPHVAEESARIVELFGEDRPDAEMIARCSSRIEIESDPDPEGDRFADFVAALDVLHKLGNIVLFDPMTGAFLSRPAQ